MKTNKLILALLTAAAFASCGKTYKVQQVTLKTQSDSVNYAMGVSSAVSLKMAFQQEDSTGKLQQKFFSEVDKAYNSSIARMSSEEIQAYFQGKSLGANIKAQPFFGDSALVVLPKVAQEAMESTLLGKKLRISVEDARPVVDRLFAKFNNDSLKLKPSKEELDSLNYAVGVSSAAQMKEYYFASDSNLVASKAYLKGLEKGLTQKEKSGILMQAESLGIGLKQASSGAGLFGDSTVMAQKDLFLQGMINALADADSVFKTINPQQYVQEVIRKQQEARVKELYGANKVAGEAFLAENAKKEGVVSTESGLQYKVVKVGKGKTPLATDRVKVHYHGTLIDGTVFDSSLERKEPSVFNVDGVIKGWTEALLLMPVGSKWTLYIPQDLAYGSADMGTIKPFSTLIFDVELISIEKK